MANWLEATGVWVLAVVVKLGLPVVALFAVGYLIYRLPRLDAQTHPGGKPHSLTGGTAKKRCWEVRGCPPKTRDKCPGYWRPDVPCWRARKEAYGGRIQRKCLSCGLLLSR